MNEQYWIVSFKGLPNEHDMPFKTKAEAIKERDRVRYVTGEPDWHIFKVVITEDEE